MRFGSISSFQRPSRAYQRYGRPSTFGPHANGGCSPKADGGRSCVRGWSRLQRYQPDRYDEAVAYTDHVFGRLVDALRELGLADRTIVVFTADHGDFMGDHQLLLKAALHYRGLVRVPCIWADPAARNAPATCDTLAGTIDLPSSILARAGVAPFNGMQGKSLSDIAAGRDRHDALIIEEDQRRGYMGFPHNFRARTLLDGRHRLTLYSCADWGELYDLADDPNEFRNLWSDPAHRSLRAELTERLARRMMALADSSPLSIGHGP
jgi:arylsulfatase A-like enzyme